MIRCGPTCAPEGTESWQRGARLLDFPSWSFLAARWRHQGLEKTSMAIRRKEVAQYDRLENNLCAYSRAGQLQEDIPGAPPVNTGRHCPSPFVARSAFKNARETNPLVAVFLRRLVARFATNIEGQWSSVYLLLYGTLGPALHITAS